MALTYLSCTDNDANLVYTCDPCNDTELGGIRSFLLIKKGTTVAVPLNSALKIAFLSNETETKRTKSGEIVRI